MHKEWLNSNKFTELNISSETLTSWTTQYYEFDILIYDSLDLTDKLFYELNENTRDFSREMNRFLI